MIAVWTSLLSDTESGHHVVGSVQDEATAMILEPLEDAACSFLLNRMSCAHANTCFFVCIKGLACSAVFVNSLPFALISQGMYSAARKLFSGVVF